MSFLPSEPMEATRSRTLAHAPFAAPTHASFIRATGPFGRSQRLRATRRTSRTLKHTMMEQPHAHSAVARIPDIAPLAASPPVNIAKNEHKTIDPANPPRSSPVGTGIGGGSVFRGGRESVNSNELACPLSPPSTNFGGGTSAAAVVLALSRDAARSEESSNAHQSMR